MMKTDGRPNPWHVLDAVSQRISQGFGIKSKLTCDSTPVHTPDLISLEETNRRIVEERLAGADTRIISSWLRQS
jgi:hypothetical protein